MEVPVYVPLGPIIVDDEVCGNENVTLVLVSQIYSFLPAISL